MRKRILHLLSVLVLLTTLIPISVSACGGFVAIKGENVFHSVYCKQITFANLDNMRWFDTAQKAKNSGLKMCESCSDYADRNFDSEYCDSYWSTKNPLILTAMELSLEYGYEMGKENAAEEYEWYYESGYEDGYDVGRDDGYYSGVRDGSEETERKIESGREEMRENLRGAVFTVIGLVCIFKIIDAIDKAKKRKK